MNPEDGKNKGNILEKTNRGMTALELAIRKNQSAAAALLLQNGAPFNIMDDKGQTPLSLATRNNNTEIKEQLLKAGASYALGRKKRMLTALNQWVKLKR